MNTQLSPSEIETVFERLQQADRQVTDKPEKVKKDPFRSLVSVMLSAQSRDEMTARAASKLFAVADTPQAIMALDEQLLRELIRDAGLYNMKSKNLKAMCRSLIDRFGGRVPATRKELMSLPGVGRKSADIMMRFTYNQPYVAVDTHVFRVARRLGMAAGKTEAQLAANLEPRIPARAAMAAHMLLLKHGKTVCRSRKPLCAQCSLNDLCRYHQQMTHL